MIWNDGKIRLDMVLKAAILGKKGRFQQMVLLVHGKCCDLLMWRILRSKAVA